MELQLLKMGVSGEVDGGRPQTASEATQWPQEGWSDAGVAAK